MTFRSRNRPAPLAQSDAPGLTAPLIAIGVDLAYSIGGDSTVAIVGAKVSVKTAAGYEPGLVLLGLESCKKSVVDVARMLLALRDKHTARLENGSLVVPPIGSYVGGQERSILGLFQERGLLIEAMHARVGKYLRSQSTAASWSSGRIILPREPWATLLASKVRAFTGREDARDDEVDALVSLHDFVLGQSWRLPEKLTHRRLRA